MRRLGHRLLTTGDDHVELPGPDQLVGQRDRVDTGQAHLVDGQRRHVPADAGGHRGLAGGHLPGAGGQHLAHDHVLDGRGGDAWPSPGRRQMAIAPRSLPEKSFSEPISLPTGVRAPATITDVVMPTSKRVLIGSDEAIIRPIYAKPISLGYLYVMTAEQVDARPVLATALVTAIDHVGIAVPDLDVAIKWYHDHLGMIVLHEEVNEDQGIREAMLSVRGAPVGSAQIQLMAPLDETSTIAKFLDKRGPGPAAVRLPGQRPRRAERAAARAGCAADLRRAAARHRELTDQLHPPQGRRRRADRARRAGSGRHRATRTTARRAARCPVRPARRVPVPPVVDRAVAESTGQTTTCAVPDGFRDRTPGTGRSWSPAPPGSA